MRVITPFGFGEAISLRGEGFLSDNGLITVTLDKPFLDQRQMMLRKEQVFVFSDWAVIRVLNIPGYGCGYFSNLQFCKSQARAEMMFGLSTPADETSFLLDLHMGKFSVNRQLGILAGNSLIIRPWVDRWAEERTETFRFIAEARDKFREEKRQNAGTSEGIETFVHLDSEGGGSILGFCLLIPPPQGIVFEREYELKSK